MPKLLFFGLIIISLVACTQKLKQIPEVPTDLIPKDTMTSLFADLRLMDAILVNDQKNRRAKIEETNLFLYNSILEKYHVSRDRFDRSFNYYASNLDEFDKIYEDVISQLAKQKAELEKELEKEE